MRGNKAFTLVEILIVVIILGILAAIALPAFSNATASARASMLADDLRVIRVQLNTYAIQHADSRPGYPSGGGVPTEVTFVGQMSQATDEAGVVRPIGTPGFKFGPYLREVPVNPFTQLKTVLVLGDAEAIPAEATGNFGWVYQPATLVFKADAPGTDDGGKLYYEY